MPKLHHIYVYIYLIVLWLKYEHYRRRENLNSSSCIWIYEHVQIRDIFCQHSLSTYIIITKDHFSLIYWIAACIWLTYAHSGNNIQKSSLKIRPNENDNIWTDTKIACFLLFQRVTYICNKNYYSPSSYRGVKWDKPLYLKEKKHCSTKL